MRIDALAVCNKITVSFAFATHSRPSTFFADHNRNNRTGHDGCVDLSTCVAKCRQQAWDPFEV